MHVIYYFMYGAWGDTSNPKTSCIRSGACFSSTSLAVGLIKENTVEADSHVAFRAHAVPLRVQHGRRERAVLYCGLEKNDMVGAWHGHGMASVNQTRPHCVNQMRKTHSKPLAARYGRGMTWARHAMCESALTVLYV